MRSYLAFMCWALGLLLLLLGSLAVAAPPAVLCIGGGGQEMAYSGLPALLREKYGLTVTGAARASLVDGKTLKQFNAVILFDAGVYNADSPGITWNTVDPTGFQKIMEVLQQYVRDGGGLYIYGSSFTHGGGAESSESINRFLKPFNAEVLFEVLRDPAREQVQQGGAQLPYALADRIIPHPATAGVTNYWYPVGVMGYGILGRPLQLGQEWIPLVQASAKCTSSAVELHGGYYPQPKAGLPSRFPGGRATIYAARALGKGRIILDSGFSTISFHGFGASEFADEHWGRVSMEKGLAGTPSQGVQLLASSLKWLTDPSVQAGNLGGFVLPPKPAPAKTKPISWEPFSAKSVGRFASYKGLFGVQPAIGGGTSTVAEYATIAREQGLSYLVVFGDFAKMDKAAWEQLCRQCVHASTDTLLVMPALLYQDLMENRFLQCGAKSWPEDAVLAKDNPKRISDHLRFMFSSGPPLRAPYAFSKGTYPTWLYSAYDSFTVHTFEKGKLTDDSFAGLLQNQHHGDQARVLSLSLIQSPAEMRAVKEYTWLFAPSMEKLNRAFIDMQWADQNYISDGPRVTYWTMQNNVRITNGELYVPGTERWRLVLHAESDVPLKQVTIYDSTRVVRRYAVTGNACDVSFDGVHDTRHVFTAVVEDAQGRRAITSSIQTSDFLNRQYFCSDRCNIMGGWSTLRNADGYHEIQPASNQLYKGGRLHFMPVVPSAGLPGIDGSGSNNECPIYPEFKLNAEGDASETRPPVHQILRPYENADLIIFDTPILKRNDSPDRECFGHGPYTKLGTPKIGARLVQYHFYRKPILSSPVLADMTMTVTAPEGVQPKKGWMDFTHFYSTSWSAKIKKYVVVRADGTRESGPSEDGIKATTWRGTLRPGDGVIYPGVGEAFFLLEGDDLTVLIECIPAQKWFRMYTGLMDTTRRPQGFTHRARVLSLKVGDRLADDVAIAACLRFRDTFGLTGQAPAYSIKPTQGQVISSRYLLTLQAKDSGFHGTIPQTDLAQRLPIMVNGVNEKWTAGKVDAARKEWYPLGVWEGATYTTVDTREGAHTLYIGNVVIADHPDVWVTLLSANTDGKTLVDVHNPTDRPLTVTVRMAPAIAAWQTGKLTVPPRSTIQAELK
ncbi:MAG: hypothetical protein ACYC7E_00945 [Armatimonadota bacterium]